MTTTEALSLGHRVRVHDLLFPYALQTATILHRAVGGAGATALGVIDRTRTPRVVSPGRVHALGDPDDLASCAWCTYRRALARTDTYRPRPPDEGGGSTPVGDDGRPRWMKARAEAVPTLRT